MKNQLDIVKHFQQFNSHGNGLIIKGRVRVGKTFLLAIITKLLLLNNFAIITNVRFQDYEFDKYSKLFYITNDKQFFECYLDIPENTPIVLIWDDIQAQKGFKSTDYEQFSNLSSFLIFIGKFDCNYVYVAHQKYIPNCILEGFNPLFLYKVQKPWFYVCDELHINNDFCSNCAVSYQPDPEKFKPLDIQSKAFSRFEFTLDLDGLFNHLSNYEIGENLRLGVREFLNKSKSVDKYYNLKDLTLKEIGLAIYFKRGIVKDSTPLNEILNPNTLSSIKKLIKNEKLL